MKCLKPQKDLTTGDVVSTLSVLNAHVIRLEQRFFVAPLSEKPSLEAGAFSFSARFMSRTTLSFEELQ